MDVKPLPLDVLFSVMAVSPRYTISAMMRTCRTLYHTSESSRLLLRDVELGWNYQVVSFLPFMLAAPSTRFHHLHALTFEKGAFSDVAVRAIKSLLAHPLFAIDALTLRDAEAVLTSGIKYHSGLWEVPLASAPLLEPFARLTTLKHLTMDAADACASEFLRTLSSSLVSVSAGFPPDPTILFPRKWAFRDYNFTTFPDPIVSLVRSTDTLEVLEGSGFSLPQTNTRLSDAIYPHVWKLRAGFKYGTWERLVAAYAHAFPNLRHLVLNKYVESYIRNTGTIQGVNGRQHIRLGNREDQLQHDSWKSLSVVEGTVSAVYALGLVCKVSELHLKDVVTEDMVTDLEVVLQDVEPETLSMTIWGAAMFREGSRLSRLLATPTLQCITSLAMTIHFAESEGDSGVEGIMDCIMFRLANLSLRRLELVLALPPIKPSDREVWEVPSTCPAEEYLKEFDFEAYISRFKAMTSTLESISVKHRRSYYWELMS
ncbi:hypothetical protein GY45DRAFT_1319872 [Cubamyces sp. BRFM 1775]|nr:hypothetical protein GY45DRAFT_1319872 [Cubamyces sp. BRFM 1775]